jgi:hypothetical protein
MIMMPVEKLTMSGTIKFQDAYEDENIEDFQRIPCKGILVKTSWLGGSDKDYTDENGNYEVEFPKNRNFHFYIKAENDAGKIKGVSHLRKSETLNYDSDLTKNWLAWTSYKEEAHILNLVHDCRRFCSTQFGWTPSSSPVTIKYPHTATNYSCLLGIFSIPRLRLRLNPKSVYSILADLSNSG